MSNPKSIDESDVVRGPPRKKLRDDDDDGGDSSSSPSDDDDADEISEGDCFGGDEDAEAPTESEEDDGVEESNADEDGRVANVAIRDALDRAAKMYQDELATNPAALRHGQHRKNERSTGGNVVTVERALDSAAVPPGKVVLFATHGPVSPTGHPVDALAELASRLARKIPPDADSRPKIAFQLGAIDSTTADFVPGPLEPRWVEECGFRKMGAFPSQVPIVRMTGCTADELSVYVRVHGFEPYLWCRLPDATPDFVESLRCALEIVRQRLDAKVRLATATDPRNKKASRFVAPYSGPTVVRIGIEYKRPIRGFRSSALPFLRLTTALPKFVPALRAVLEAEGSISDDAPPLECYEADVPYVLRFMVDRGVKGCDWVSIDRSKAAGVRRNPGNSLEGEGGGYCERRRRAEERIAKFRSSSRACKFQRKSDASSSDFVTERLAQREEEFAIRATEKRMCEDLGPDGGDAFGGKFEAAFSPARFGRKRRRDDDEKDEWFRPLPRFEKCAKGESRCTYEIDAFWESVEPMGSEGVWAAHAPQRVFSFDSEWTGKGAAFPERGKDPLITVCFSVGLFNDPKPRTCVALQLAECNPVPDATTIWFDDERTLFMALRDLHLAYDPDVDTGYNINNFDFAYLFERAKTLGIAKRFADMGRVRSEPARCVKGGASLKTKAQALEVNEIVINGVHMLDAQIAIKREHKLGSYTLNAVSARFLNMQKLDVSPKRLPGMQSGTPEMREEIAEYCKRDSELPFLLLGKLMTVTNYVEMARATGVPVSYLLTRGQQIKVAVQMYRLCRRLGIVIDSGRRRDVNQMEGKYEGATVLPPVRGFHDYPVATLDFSSLYPTIMISRNLCYSTLLTRELMSKLHPDNYEVMPHGDAFVSAPKYFDEAKLAKLGVGASPIELKLMPETQFEVVAAAPPDSVLVDDYSWKFVDGATVDADFAKRLKLAEKIDYVISADDAKKATITRRCRDDKTFCRSALATLDVGGRPESFGFRRDREYDTEPSGKWYLKGPGPVPLAAVRLLQLKEGPDYAIDKNDAKMAVVDTTRRIGILPLILQGLLSARGVAKKLLAAEKDPSRKAVYDGRQLALKITANSVYGFTGAQRGRLPEPRIASNVTAVGRKMIKLTKNTVERKCERVAAAKRGLRRDDLPKVLYGDTDSVMVDFRLRAPLGRCVFRMCAEAVKARARKYFESVAIKAKQNQTPAIADGVAVPPVSASQLEAVEKMACENLTAFSEREFPMPEPTGAELVATWSRPKHAADANKVLRFAVETIVESTKTILIASGFAGSEDAIVTAANAAVEELRVGLFKEANWAFDIGLVEEAARLGRIACKEVSSMLPWPCSLAFEKVFLCFLLVSKKRYAGLKLIEGWSNELKKLIMKFEKDPAVYGIDAVSTSGLETVRRDNCMLVRQTAKATLAKVVLERDVRGAVAVVRRAAKQVYERDLSLDMLVITTGYSRKETGYLGKQKHTEVVKKMRARDPANAPKIGDRVPFVMTAKWKGVKGFEQSEDPIYVMEHDVPIDIKYYIEKQLTKPITRVLKAVVPNAHLLFSPTATIDDILGTPKSERDLLAAANEPKIVVKTGMRVGGGCEGETLGKFAIRVGQPCLGCGLVLRTADAASRLAPALCSACASNEKSLKERETKALVDVEDAMRAVDEKCEKCRKQMTNSGATSDGKGASGAKTSTTCANVECPTLFVRGKLSRDLREKRERIARFDVVVVLQSESKNDDRDGKPTTTTEKKTTTLTEAELRLRSKLTGTAATTKKPKQNKKATTDRQRQNMAKALGLQTTKAARR